MENKIDVYYNSSHVGTLARYEDKYLFQYSDNWLKSGFSISPLSLPLKKEVFVPKNMNFNGFFGVFSDSLPDAWGNLLLDRYLKKNGIENNNGLYRLSLIGNLGMGALEYSPSIKDNYSLDFNLDKFQEEANNILESKDFVDVDYLYHYSFSSGGARPKALIKYQNEDWIVKFQSHYDVKNAGLVEYEYALCCKNIGIDMSDVKLFESSKGKGYFGIKRFDRINNKKVHMISASALLEADFRSPCCDYLDLFKLTKYITNENEHDIKQLYLRMCFNVYAHNLDDHLKNFSYLFNEESKTYRLSPAYDMMYSNTYFNEHQTSVNSKGKNIEKEDLIMVGVKSGLNKKYCVETLDKVINEINNKLLKYLK